MAELLPHSPRERFNISRIAIEFPRQTVAFWLAVMVAGLLAFSSLKYALFPDISFPILVVTAQESSQVNTLETDAKVTKPLDNILKELPYVDEVYSITYPQQAVINILYQRGVNIETATSEVNQALAKANIAPQVKLEVFALNLNESSVITYAITSSTKDLNQLIDLSQKSLLPALKELTGVLKVNLLGDSRRQDKTSLVPQYPTLTRFQGQPSLALQVIKKSNASTLEVVKLVNQEITKLQTQYPELQFHLAETQAKYIQEATKATIEELIGAIILAVIVIFFFLGTFKATLIPALAIPTSLLGTFIVMAWFGFNLETLTLLALAMVIGIVVDDAIVDVENIARLIDLGQSPRKAALNGTNEIGLSVVASTLTIVAVFLPVGLMGGSVGQFFKPFGLTVSAAVLFSLLVARTLSPVLAIWWLKPRTKNTTHILGTNSALVRLYERVLYWSLRHRGQVVSIALISFLAGLAFIPLIAKGFVPKLERGELNIIYTTALPKITLQPQSKTSEGGAFDWLDNLAKSPETFLLKRTISAGKRLESVILKSPEVESIFTIAGVRGEPNQGKIYIKLKEERTLTTAQFQDYIRKALPKFKGVSISVEDIPFVQTEADKPLQLAIVGTHIGDLFKVAQTLKTSVASEPGFLDVALSNETDQVNNPLKIERLSGNPAIYLSANLAPNLALEDAALKVEQLAKSLLPQDIKLKRWGNSAHSEDVLSSFGLTIGLSSLLMLLVLFLLFGRLLEPIVIGLSLPLAIIGALFGLWVTKSDFGIISLIGLIFLLGLVSKNSILLLDYINQLRKLGKTREEAILETGKIRLRPILMTTAATVLGMLPITLGLGAGAELRQPMAVAIVGGLITSTLLSLIVVPVFYTLLEDAWTNTRT